MGALGGPRLGTARVPGGGRPPLERALPQPPATADRLVDLVGGRGDSDKDPHELLSTQEHRVMQMIAAGKTPAQMAELMQVSVKTVGTYRARILEKTGWKSTAELTRYCVQHGLAHED